MHVTIVSYDTTNALLMGNFDPTQNSFTIPSAIASVPNIAFISTSNRDTGVFTYDGANWTKNP